MTTKICSKCGEEYDISHFSWSIKGIKRHAKCLKCRSEERIDYYNRHKEEELKYKYERQVNKREEARLYVFTYLTDHPCVDCHETDPLVLTFDHVRGKKKMNISQMVNQGYSIETLQDEITKCEVRCMNCHMRIEKKRRGTIYPGV
jgi:hypothetical protein